MTVSVVTVSTARSSTSRDPARLSFHALDFGVAGSPDLALVLGVADSLVLTPSLALVLDVAGSPGRALVVDVGCAPGYLLLRTIGTLALAIAVPARLASRLRSRSPFSPPSRLRLRSPFSPPRVCACESLHPDGTLTEHTIDNTATYSRIPGLDDSRPIFTIIALEGVFSFIAPFCATLCSTLMDRCRTES